MVIVAAINADNLVSILAPVFLLVPGCVERTQPELDEIGVAFKRLVFRFICG